MFPFCAFYENDGEGRTSDLIVHSLTPCLRRYSLREEVVRLKVLHNKCYLEFLPSKVDFHHIGYR